MSRFFLPVICVSLRNLRTVFSFAWLFILLTTTVSPLAAAPKMERANNSANSVIVYAPDVVLANRFLKLAVDTRQACATILGLPKDSDNRLIVQVLPVEPHRPWPLPSTTVGLRGKQLDFMIVVRVPDPQVVEEFLRTQTQVHLYERILSGNTLHAGQDLPMLPLWLSEGTLQIVLQSLVARETRDWESAVNLSRDRDWERVVERAKSLNRAPMLDTVTRWQELSNYTLERIWQQSFSYYLVSILARPGTARDGFQNWLESIDPAKADPFHPLPPLVADEFAWRAQLARSTERSHDLIYTWEETVEKMNAAMAITLDTPGGKGEPVQTTIDKLEPYKNHPGLADAVQDKLKELTDIDLRANIFWHAPLACYRNALMVLVNLQPPAAPQDSSVMRGSKNFSGGRIPVKTEYADYIAAAREWTESLSKKHEAVADYLNWVVVTKSVNEPGSPLASYYALQKKLAQFQPRQSDVMSRAVLRIEKNAMQEIKAE